MIHDAEMRRAMQADIMHDVAGEKLLPFGKKGIVLLGSLYSFIWMRGCDVP